MSIDHDVAQALSSHYDREPVARLVDEQDGYPPPCSHCGASMVWEDCDLCDEGYTSPGLLHECEPDWYDEDDVEPCEQCEAKGGWWACLDRQCSEDRRDLQLRRHVLRAIGADAAPAVRRARRRGRRGG